jgi:hypothetical protein
LEPDVVNWTTGDFLLGLALALAVGTAPMVALVAGLRFRNSVSATKQAIARPLFLLGLLTGVIMVPIGLLGVSFSATVLLSAPH